MTKNKIYAGIGSRDTPISEKSNIIEISGNLCTLGYTLRSGGARRADLFFESGVHNINKKEIYKPYPGFGGAGGIIAPDLPNWIDAINIAKKHHPNWRAVERKKEFVFLMGRNVYQVLGEDLNTPVDFILFWASGVKRDSKNKIMDCDGGTGLAVRLAYSYGIDIYHTQEDLDFIKNNILSDKSINTQDPNAGIKKYNYTGKWKRR